MTMRVGLLLAVVVPGLACQWRTVRPEKIDPWPPAISWEIAEQGKPSLTVAFLPLQRIKNVAGKPVPLDGIGLEGDLFGFTSEQAYKELVVAKFIQSGLFRKVTTDIRAKSDLFVEIRYTAKRRNFPSVYDIISGVTLFVVPSYLSSQNMITMRVLRGGLVRGEASAFEKENTLFWLPVLFVGIAQKKRGYQSRTLEIMIEEMLSNGLEQGLFNLQGSRQVSYHGRIFQWSGATIYVKSSLTPQLKPGQLLGVFHRGKEIGKIRVLIPSENYFTAALVKGQRPSIGMLVGRR